jgi:glycosyltransferase involved in cell wall biosynthesis
MSRWPVVSVAVAIFAHQEEARIATCLRSLPLDRPDTRFHILVNGTTDRTAAIARRFADGRPHVVVHDLPEGGKARTWNRFIFDLERHRFDAFVFLDGDAEIAPGSIDALVDALAADPSANAAAGMPLNGRRHRAYRRQLRTEGGLFGDLYALSGDFVARMRERNIRLPDDLVGDDGLLAAFAYTDLGPDKDWDRRRVIPCGEAGFLCEPVSLLSPASWRMQHRRMIAYATRHFQNRIITAIMRDQEPEALPSLLAGLYPEWLPRMRPRGGIDGYFDRIALRRMRDASGTTQLLRPDRDTPPGTPRSSK